jgi:ComF family protein
VTFEGEGPAWTLVKALKSGKAPGLAKGLAGYMAMQLLNSSHQIPDLIVPVPQSVFRSLQIGYNPAHLLAVHLGKILDRPVDSLLKRSLQLLRQTQLPADQRRRLSASQFHWRKRIALHEKTVLLVDDLIGTGATFRCCTQRLSEAFPLKIIKMAAVRQEV